MDDEDVTDSTRDKVFKRDGKVCWLCGDPSPIVNIAHQIHTAASEHPFPLFKANGTITIPDLSHPDNLFPLCPSCHAGYDSTFPEWIMIPDTDTLHQYLEHEKKDFDHRQLSEVSLPRTLPSIDRTKVIYHPSILSTQFYLQRLGIGSELPKHWPGLPPSSIEWHGVVFWIQTRFSKFNWVIKDFIGGSNLSSRLS
jgi:hypothetical protein